MSLWIDFIVLILKTAVFSGFHFQVIIGKWRGFLDETVNPDQSVFHYTYRNYLFALDADKLTFI